MAWLISNLGTIVVAAILLGIVYLAARSVGKDISSGGCSGCGGSCGGGCHCSQNNGTVTR